MYANWTRREIRVEVVKTIVEGKRDPTDLLERYRGNDTQIY